MLGAAPCSAGGHIRSVSAAFVIFIAVFEVSVLHKKPVQ